jgi:predicted GTPase
MEKISTGGANVNKIDELIREINRDASVVRTVVLVLAFAVLMLCLPGEW